MNNRSTPWHCKHIVWTVILKRLTSKPVGFMQNCCTILFCRKNAQIIIIIIISRSKMASSCLIYQTFGFTSQINSWDPGKYLPELPNFMQYYTQHHMHVMRTSSVHAHMSSAHACCPNIICSTPHGQHGPKLSFYSDRNWLLNRICCKNVELFHFRIM